MLQAENERINKILKSRQSEIEDWKVKAHTLQTNIDNFSVVERDMKALEDQFNNQVKSNEELQFVLKKMEKDVSNYREYEAQSRDLERQNLALGKEIERLNTIIRNNSHEAEDYRTRINRLEGNIHEYKNIEYRVKEFENKIAMLVQ